MRRPWEGGRADLTSRSPDEPLPAESLDSWRRLLADDRVAELITETTPMHGGRLSVDYLAGQDMLESTGWSRRRRVARPAGVAHLLGHEVGPVPRTPCISTSGAARSSRRWTPRSPSNGSHSRETAPTGSGFDPFHVATPVACVETLTASGKPRVVDYRRGADGSVDPVFSPATNGQVVDDGDRVDLWAGALGVAANLPARRQLDGWGVQSPRSRTRRATPARPLVEPSDGGRGHLHRPICVSNTTRPAARSIRWPARTRGWRWPGGAGSRRAWVRGSELMTPAGGPAGRQRRSPAQEFRPEAEPLVGLSGCGAGLRVGRARRPDCRPGTRWSIFGMGQ